MINIRARVRHLVQKYGTRDPERLAKELGIYVVRKEYSPHTKGYFIRIHRNKFITVNSTLDHYSQKIVLAHELGHAVLHYNFDVRFIREYTLFPIGKYEIEANKFAAELLIDESEICKDWTTTEISIALNVPKQLVEYKFGAYLIAS